MHGNFRGRNRNNNSFRDENVNNYYTENDQRNNYRDQNDSNQNDLDESRLVELLENANLKISVQNDYRHNRLRSNRGFSKGNYFRDDSNLEYNNSRNRGFTSYGRPRGWSRGFNHDSSYSNYNDYDNSQDHNERGNRERALSAGEYQDDRDRVQTKDTVENVKKDSGEYNNSDNNSDQRNRNFDTNINRRQDVPQNYERNNRGFQQNYNRQNRNNQNRQSSELRDNNQEFSAYSDRQDDNRGSHDEYSQGPSRGIMRNQNSSNRQQGDDQESYGPNDNKSQQYDNVPQNRQYHEREFSGRGNDRRYDSGQTGFRGRIYSSRPRNFDRRGGSDSFRPSRNARLGGRNRGWFQGNNYEDNRHGDMDDCCPKGNEPRQSENTEEERTGNDLGEETKS